MKKIIFLIAALTLSAGGAFAENSHVGEPATLYAQDRASLASKQTALKLDYTATASIYKGKTVYQDGSAHRFGDASPSSYK